MSKKLDGQIAVVTGASKGIVASIAEHLAAGPGQDPGGRDPRPGDGPDCRAGVLDGAHGVQHAAHQRRAEHDHPAARHGGGAVPDHGVRGRDHGAAAGAEDLPGVQDRVRAVGRDADGTGSDAGDGEGQEVLLRPRLRPLPLVQAPALGDRDPHQVELVEYGFLVLRDDLERPQPPRVAPIRMREARQRI